MLTVLATWPLATIQDQGRPGHAALGVSRSGAADRASLRLANRLVGNDEAAAGIEVTFGGLAIRTDTAVVVALTGASGPAHVDNRGVPLGEPFMLPAGAALTLGQPVVGLRTYVAFAGGIDLPPVLGSRSTDTLSGIGPPTLRTDVRLLLGAVQGPPQGAETVPGQLAGDLRLHVVLGPRDDWLTTTAVERLLSAPWQVGSRADRVGVRLDGPPLDRRVDAELPSEGCVRGSVQVSADGAPTVFGPDHPVTGGYPVMAVVVDDDCDQLGQARPGDVVRFERRPGP